MYFLEEMDLSNADVNSSPAMETEKSFSFGRTTKAGFTGTYRIVFRNGVTVDLEAVELLYKSNGSGPKVPSFKANYDNGEDDVAHSASGGYLDPKEIVAIIRMSEDKDGKWPA